MAREVVDGAEETKKALNQLVPAIRKQVLRKVTRQIMKEDVFPAALDRVPYLTGELHDALIVRAAKLKRGSKNVGASVQTRDGLFQGETFYGGFQEFGWFHWKDGSFVSGSPFLRPSLYENSQEKARKFGKLTGKMIPKVVEQIRDRNFKRELRSRSSVFNPKLKKLGLL